MTLGARDKLLYARHLLLPEVGHGGQSALCAARLSLPDDADPRATEVARDYLERSGVSVSSDPPTAHRALVPVPTTAEVERIAGDEGLREAAAALAGAFAAVEAIKAVIGAGEPGTLGGELELG